jgi:3'-phosphoadenosine 5'-phosphosulfate sulfotransferase (PAPS reductase)/FAD synthetase
MTYTFPALETAPQIDELLVAGAPVAIGVSGGKDSDVAAAETLAYLKQVGHTGSRILIHSDLGRIEWKDSLPVCERLARRYDLELVVVKRQAGDLMDRWLVRWRNNCERYAQLQCVKLILPWSTVSMRFCTSELKTTIICRDLVERYPGQTILSVVGLRRQESATRAHAPVYAPQARLTSATYGTNGYNWHPLLAWTLEDVLTYHHIHNIPLHEAYMRYGTTRVSCAFCILSSLHDLVQSARCPDNYDIYRELVELETVSTFSFQEGRWLGDIALHLLSEEALFGLREAKRRASLREQVETRIPKHLLYTKGWPRMMPTPSEARLLSDVRKSVAEVMELSIHYTEPEAIEHRYAELMATNTLRGKAQPIVNSFIQQEVWTREGVTS